MAVNSQYIFKVVTPHSQGAHNLINVYEVMPDGGAMLIAPCSCMSEAAEVMSNYIRSTSQESEDSND